MSEPNTLPRWEPQVHIDPILLDDCSECEAQIRELTAELKELREFVGAMHNCVLADGAFCCEVDDGVWHLTDVHDDLLASGTDPFDAWRKMNAGEGE